MTKTDQGGSMTTTWSNYIRMSDEEFEFLNRAGVSDERIAAMKATRAEFDAQHNCPTHPRGR
jgi:hypothetical protein